MDLGIENHHISNGQFMASSFKESGSEFWQAFGARLNNDAEIVKLQPGFIPRHDSDHWIEVSILDSILRYFNYKKYNLLNIVCCFNVNPS